MVAAHSALGSHGHTRKGYSKNKRTFKVTHNIPESKIFNAPDEMIKSSDIIDTYRT